MADPTNSGITLTITADPAQADSALSSFSTHTQAELKQMAADAAKLNAIFANLGAGLKNSSPAAAAGVAAAAAGFKQAGQAAQQASVRIAGMTYYVRSGIDAIRLAAAGGGARAGFYAIDEAIRGLLASGMSLTRLVPVLGGIAVAAGGAYLVWREWTSATREAEKAAEDLSKQLKGVAGLFDQIAARQKAGLLSAPASQRLQDVLTGKVKLYRDREGNITENPTSQVGASTQFLTGSSYFQPAPIQIPAHQVDNRALAGNDLVKYLQDQLAVQGKLDDSEVTAKNKLADLEAQIHGKRMSDTEAEIAKIHQKYAAEREELNRQSTGMGGLLTDEQRLKLKTALEESEANESVEVNRKRNEEINRLNEESLKARADFARAVNENLDKALDAEAVKQNKTREQLYEEEYHQRIAILQTLRLTGFLTEKQYTDAVVEAQQKRLDGAKKEAAETDRLARERLQTIQETVRMQRELAASNQNLTRQEQLSAAYPSMLSEAILVQQQLNAQRAIANGPNSNDQQKVQANREVAQLMLQQVQLQNQMFQATRPWLAAWGQVAQHLREMHDLAQTTAKTFEQVFDSAINSISENLTKVIEGTESWGEALRNVGSSILNELISAVVKLAVQTIVSMVATAVFGQALAETAAAAYSATWAAPAILASIASYGGAAAAAPGEVMAALAFAPGIAGIAVAARERGGPLSAGQLGLVGERGPELIVPQADSHVLNASDTRMLLNLARSESGRTNSTSSQSPRPQHFLFFSDKSEITNHIRQNPEAQIAVIDIVRRNVHFIQPQAQS